MLPKDTNDKDQKKNPTTTASPRPANSIFNKTDANKTMPKSQEQAKSSIASRSSITSNSSNSSFTKPSSTTSTTSSVNTATKTSVTTNTTISKTNPSSSSTSSTNKTSTFTKASSNPIISSNTSSSTINTSAKTSTIGQSTASTRPNLQKDLNKTTSISTNNASTNASTSTSTMRTAHSSNSLVNRPTSSISTLNKASTSPTSSTNKSSIIGSSTTNTTTTSIKSPTKLVSSTTSSTKASATSSNFGFNSNSSLASSSNLSSSTHSNSTTDTGSKFGIAKVAPPSTSTTNRTNPSYTSTSSSYIDTNSRATSALASTSKTVNSQISGFSSSFTTLTNKNSTLDTNKSNISKEYQHTKLTTIAEKTAKVFPQIPTTKQDSPTSPASISSTSSLSNAFNTTKDNVNSLKLAATPLNVTANKAELSDKDFVLLRDFIHKQSGIFINDNRKYLVQNRLSSIITELGLNTFADYYEYITKKDSTKSGLNKLFEAITTNETFFFRNIPQLDTLRDLVLKKIIDDNKSARKLRIWSAGCSSGEEPYTIAIMLCELLGRDIDKWDIKITANDLSPAVLELAKAGVYNEYTLRTTPPEYLTKYFDKEGLGYRVKPSLKKLITFGQINLNESSQTSKVEKSNLVLCRNVIIYFDDDVKRNVVKNFADNLLNNGVLVIGHSESLHNITTSFETKHYPGTVIYHKK